MQIEPVSENKLELTVDNFAEKEYMKQWLKMGIGYIEITRESDGIWILRKVEKG